MSGVLVIGGGPAGASFAARLAQLGAEVTLIERLAFPRPRLGESLTPGVRDLLSATGVWPSIERAGFSPARDVRVVWEEESILRMKPGSEGLLVDRARFDALLLSHAARQGVRVLQPAQVLSATRTERGWDVIVDHEGGQELIPARILADARGRSSLAGARRSAFGQRTLAVHADWSGEGLPPHATVAAGERGWFWGIPLPGGRYAAQAFLAPSAFHALAGSTLESRYERLIEASPLGPGLGAARRVGKVSAIDATPYLAEEPATADTIRLGDAALALDPISSSGVQKAIQTALSGAIVANTLLKRPAAAAAAQQFYRSSLGAAAARHAKWSGAHYAAAARSRGDAFWTARSMAMPEEPDRTVDILAGQELTLSPEARLVDVACLGHDFVEMKQSLVHPALDEPVAFLAHQPVAPLLSAGTSGSIAALAQGWSSRMPHATALSIAIWLRQHGILVPADDVPAGAAA